MPGRTARRRVLRVRATADVPPAAESRADLLAVEEPLEIRVHGEPLTVTMRTPGDDIDLAAGFLAGEGVLASADDVTEIRLCDENTADVTLAGQAKHAADGLRRNFLTTSACGVCGKDTIDAIRVGSRYDVAADPVRLDPALLAGLPGRLREAQRVFDSTGGLHAAGLFRADGTLLAMREDVGRHNAVDKVIGWALRERLLPLAGCVLLVSGRASFELTQKAFVAGVPVLAAVSAPSSLAAELATDTGMTLVGFLRGPGMNVYAGAHRIAGAGLTGAERNAAERNAAERNETGRGGAGLTGSPAGSGPGPDGRGTASPRSA
ncbi:MAG: formate dehydrogenase accessory sulfurtransferase FdhD [Actinobacteria bacterium]|nr:formate dehydrogenase accessory sulfurtransferase FdhD [Actinomycetota bacterium]